MILTDTVTIQDKSIRRTADGYLAATALVARAGNVQRYLGAELGRPDKEYVDVYRPEDEVFSADTLKSFAHRPLTNDHPPEQVTSDNWKKYAVGYSGDEVARDGDMVRVPLLMTDSDAIAAFEAGKRELSMGYSADIEWTDGVTPDGQHYDAIQRNIRNNHTALVDKARAGHKARIGDADGQNGQNYHNGGHTMADMQTVVIDGLSVETTKQGAEALKKLQDQLVEVTAKIETQDAEIAKRDAQIDDLKAKQMDDAKLDEMVRERTDLLAVAKRVADIDYKGKSLVDIRKAAVHAKLGDKAVADKSDAYIEARFDSLVDGLQDEQTKTTETHQHTDAFKEAEKAHADYVNRIYGGK